MMHVTSVPRSVREWFSAITNIIMMKFNLNCQVDIARNKKIKILFISND